MSHRDEGGCAGPTYNHVSATGDGAIAAGRDVHQIHKYVALPCPDCEQRFIRSGMSRCSHCATRHTVDELKMWFVGGLFAWLLVSTGVIVFAQRVGWNVQDPYTIGLWLTIGIAVGLNYLFRRVNEPSGQR